MGPDEPDRPIKPAHGGRHAAEALRRRGVDRVFALAGDHVMHLLDGCLDAGIHVVDTRHEGGAALAAEGHALATGRLGVAVVTAGAGFANALVGLLDAATWSVPLLLIAGRTGTDKAGRGAVQDIDQLAIVAPAVKRALRCTDPARIAGAVEEACHHATSGRPGAVYLEIPADVYEAVDVPQAPTGFPATAPRAAAAPDDLVAAAATLAEAQRPVAIAGTGAFMADAGDALGRFAAAWGVPVTTTSAARGLLPDGAPWCLGGLVHGGAAVLSADVVVVLGSRFNGNLAFGRSPLFRPDQRVIQVDVDPGGIGGNRAVEVGIVGDVGVVLDALTARAPAVVDRGGWPAEAAATVGAMRGAWDQQVAEHHGPLLHPGAVAREVAAVTTEHYGDRCTFVADGGDALAWALAYLPAPGRGRLLTTTTALGTLGVGVPFAIAARAARPTEPVVLFTGDGAFGLSAIEIDTAVRHALPIVVVVSNNAAWVDVVHAQRRRFGTDRTVAARLRASRYDRLAEALGGHGEHVEVFGDLRPAIERALGSGRPSVVDVRTDPGVLSALLANIGDLDVM